MAALDWILGRNRGASDSAQPSATAGADVATAVDYVDWLMSYVLRSPQHGLVIRSTEDLPGSGEDLGKGPPPPCLPPPVAVINRLKIVAGLTPVHYSAPREAIIRKSRSSCVLTYTTRFEDRPGESTCSIQVRIGK